MAASMWKFVRADGRISPSFLSKRFYPALPQRFYKQVSITNVNNHFEINLDSRKLKTPLGKVFQVPNEALAISVATEWDSQKQKIYIPHMHLTGLCYTAIDNPARQTKESICDTVVQMIDSDTLCYRSNEPPDLIKYQEEKWDPVLQWFTDRYKIQLNVSHDVSTAVVPESTRSILKKHLMSYNDWAVLGFQFAAESLKSFVLTLAAVDCYLDVPSCVALSNLEVEFQTKQWGTIDWGHTIEFEQTKARVAAGVLFVHFNSESTQLLQKSPAEVR